MLEGHVILITGSNSGIGFATAKLCLKAGAKVVVHGRDRAEVKAAAEQLGKLASFVVADLSEPGAPEKIIADINARFGRLDGLVNNAARLDRNNIESLSEDLFFQMMTVNTLAPLKLIQAALPVMKAQSGGGAVVNIGSTNAHCGATNLLVYSMSKGAMMTATRNLGDALAKDNIRVNQLNVGWTLTESEKRLQISEGQGENWLENIPEAFTPSGTILQPEQIAEHVIFWLSDKSAPVTGQVCDIEQYPVIGRNKISER